MDINIKSEPDILEDTVSQSCEVKKMDEFTLYLKKRFLETFHREGCTPQVVAGYAKGYNINVEEVNEFFDAAAKEAQQYVYQECDSLSFSNITEWLNYFQASGVSSQCNYESALVMNAIANNEYHPEPEAMLGVNFKAIYKFLSNALMGRPQTPLDEASAKFLSNEFQNLINEANTDEADDDVRNMKRKIEYSLSFNNTNHRFYNLDPLNTDHAQLERCCITNVNYNNLKLKNIVTMLKK
ncbi:uncharacterized protein LOC135954370 isoform X2 [Calliphora vicina]|uniref:uncharacterized protein LOC135954370 isoform X2 n=1 Tax=Calliphora vicina TaxID=7373 RepID=UPI00325AEFF1